MTVTTVTYKREGGTLVIKGYKPNAPAACSLSYYYAATEDSISQRLDNTESRTLVKGDRVHAQPFTGRYVDQSPMAGKLRFAYRNTNASGPDKKCCGDAAGTYMSYSGDAGYWFGSPPSEELMTRPDLEAYLKQVSETKALADLRRSYYNLGILLAERRQTINYVVGKAKLLSAAVNKKQQESIRRYLASRKADRKMVAKDIAGEHLGFLFGFLPLVDELSGICEMLSQERSVRLTGRGRMAEIKISSARQQIRAMNISSSVLPAAIDCVVTTTTKYSSRTSITVEVTSEGLAKLREHGFNAFATFYDLVPLSFLSDFVSNLGTFVRALDPLLGVKFVTGSTTIWRETSKRATVQGATHRVVGSVSVQTVEGSGAGQSSSRHLCVARAVLTDYPEPSFHFQNNLSWGKAATIASLAIQRSIKPAKRLIKLMPFRYRGPRPKYLPPIKYR